MPSNSTDPVDLVNQNATHPIVALWCMRVIMRQYGLVRNPCRGLLPDDIRPIPVLRELLEVGADDEDDYQAIESTWPRFRALYQKAERELSNAALPPILAHNITRIGQLLNLSPAEQHVLAFCILLRADLALGNVIRVVDDRIFFTRNPLSLMCWACPWIRCTRLYTARAN